MRTTVRLINTLLVLVSTGTVRAQESPRHLSSILPTAPISTLLRTDMGSQENSLVFDSEFKLVSTKLGETNIHVFFWLTNDSELEIMINRVRPSCGCTVAKLPQLPWRLAAGESGPIEAVLDLRGKMGTLKKTLTVESSSGVKVLRFEVAMNDGHGHSPLADPDRLRNMQLTFADRQIVFKRAECAQCHAGPAEGKTGAELYVAACGICHDSPQRATMVPDLSLPKPSATPGYWRHWITYGRPGSLMPAFAQSESGPLTPAQIESLVTYLIDRDGAGHPSASAVNSSRPRN